MKGEALVHAVRLSWLTLLGAVVVWTRASHPELTVAAVNFVALGWVGTKMATEGMESMAVILRHLGETDDDGDD